VSLYSRKLFEERFSDYMVMGNLVRFRAGLVPDQLIKAR